MARRGVYKHNQSWCVDLEAQQKGLDVLSSFQIEDTGRERVEMRLGGCRQSRRAPPPGGRVQGYFLTCCTLHTARSTYPWT